MEIVRNKSKEYTCIDFFDKVRESNRIGFPCTPSEWKSDVTDGGKVTCITISCGGGMGGSRWNEFAIGDIRKDIVPNSIIAITDKDGHEKQINTNFIVCTKVYNVKEVVLFSENDRVRYNGIHILRWIVNTDYTETIHTVDNFDHDFWNVN